MILIQSKKSILFVCLCVGFLEKEVKKDGIPMLDTGDNPDAPAPREMIDLEVGNYSLSLFFFGLLSVFYLNLSL